MPFEIKETDISGLKLILPKLYYDERGYFCEIYKQSDFTGCGIGETFIQDNFSQSRKGVLRGLHFQLPPHAQGKLVQCVRGEIFDVAVDLRRNSQTFGKWQSFTLTEENHHILYIPAGFAHGFYTLSDNALVLYKATREYSPTADKGIIWNDPDLNIDWQLNGELIVSSKDQILPKFKEVEAELVHE